MKLQMHSIHFDADKKLLDFIQKKVNKLETFHDRIVNGEVILKIDKDEEKENKVIEIKLFIPGNMLFAKEQSKSFEAAADVVVETMKRQLKKYKEKQVPH
jgi:putative sigma-54 modulation protein